MPSEARLKLKPSKGGSEKESEVQRVHRLIKGWILECELRPGDFVSELQLARLCKSSRTPVREACSRLFQDKWIQRLPRRGYLVPPVSRQEIAEVYEYRTLIEGFAAERAARLASREDLGALREMTEKELKPGLPRAELLAVNDAFHLAVAGLARNQRIVDQLRLTLEYVHRLDVLSLEQEHDGITHGAILSALRSGEPARSRRAMAAHIESARDRMLKIFKA